MAMANKNELKFAIILVLSTWVTLITAVSLPPDLKLYAKPPDSDKLELIFKNPHNNILLSGPIALEGGGTSSEVVLECTAPYPIEWNYEGDGWGPDSPERLAGSKALRNVTVTYYQYPQQPGQRQGQGRWSRQRLEQSQPEYKATITGLHLHERITGKYICQRPKNTNKWVGEPELSSSIYLIIPYNTPKFNRKTQQFDPPLPLRTFLRYPTHNGSVLLYNLELGQVTIPCSVSDPAVDVRLFKVESGQERELPIEFDPRTGFMVRESRREANGDYVCRIMDDATKVLRVNVFDLSGDNRETRSPTDFEYNPKTRELSCGTSGAQSERTPRPVLEKLDCGPELECRFRRHYYFTEDKKGKSNVILLPRSTVLQEGWIRCSAGRDGFQETIFSLDPESGRFRSGGEDFDALRPMKITILGKEEITLPALDELVIQPKDELAIGEELLVKCHLSRAEYATGDGSFIWWAENGRDKEVLPCTNSECKIRVTDAHLELKAVHCSAPLLLTGKTAAMFNQEQNHPSLPVFVKGPVEPPRIKLAFVRDTQDFEVIGDEEMLQAEEIEGKDVSSYYNASYKGYRFTARDFGVNSQTLYVQCRAQYPVEWTYKGYYAPQLMTTTQRYVPPRTDGTGDPLDNRSSHYFITELIIQSFTVDCTGEYVCRKITSYRDQSRVYLYFADPDTVFLPHPPDTARIQYTGDPTTSRKTIRRRFHVHCPVSDPAREIALWQQDLISEEWFRWPGSAGRGNRLIFIPKIGFEVHPDQNQVAAGVYECRDAGGSGQISQRTEVSSKFENIRTNEPGQDVSSSEPFKVTPSEARVPLNPPRIQVLVCESHEEVTLLFTDPALRSSLVISRNATGNTNYRYSALAIVETSKLRGEGGRPYFSQVGCVRVADQQQRHRQQSPDFLHKWALTELQPGQISKFIYENRTDSYTCCGTGYLKPQISIVRECHSVTECRLQACLKNPKCAQGLAPTAKQRAKPVETQAPGCTSMKIDANSQEGMLLCDLGMGDVPYVSFSYLLYHRDPETREEVHTRFWNMNSDAIRGEGPTDGSSLLKIRRIRSRSSRNWERARDDTDQNRAAKFECEGSKFFFSLGFQWALQRHGGMPDLLEQSWSIDKLFTTGSGRAVYKSSLHLDPNRLRGVERVYCYAPEWNSYLWRTAWIEV